MYWNRTEGLWKEFHEVDLNSEMPLNNMVDYESFTQAILADMRMVDLTRRRMNTEADFLSFVHHYFPLDSEAFKWAKKIISLKYYLNKKNEFIACFRRSDTKEELLYLPRAEVEYDPEYVQVVAMALPYFTLEDGTPVFIFVLESLSDMQGHATMIGGHIQYVGGIRNANTYDTILIHTAQREASEELGIDHNALKFQHECPCYVRLHQYNNTLGSIRFDTRNEVEMESISYYHIGIGYWFEISKNIVNDIRLEEGKDIFFYAPIMTDEKLEVYYRGKNVTIHTKNSFSKHQIQPDSWLELLMDSLSVK